MDEQLEQPIERGGAEAQSEEAVLPPASEETAKETAERTNNQETEVKTESSAEEKVTPDAELSSSEDPNKPSPGGQRSGATGVNDLPVAGQSRGVTEPQREGGSERSPASSETDEVTPRNHYAEWQELAAAHPEVVGKELPEDIYQECMRSELPPLRVYESMMLQKQAEQIAALQQEIATLRQNAENTARAPVSASAGSPENEPEDLFLQGLYSY